MNGSSTTDVPKVFGSEFLDPNDPKDNLAVIILNWRLPTLTPLILEKASFCVCADGGANRLHDEVPLMFPEQSADAVRARFLPHLIKGDLDSIRPDVLQFYSQRGVPVADLSQDQASTDLQKCLMYIEQHLLIGGGGDGAKAKANAEGGERNDAAMSTTCQRRQIDTIVAVGAHGGRLDHILSNLSTLYTFRHMNIVLCGDGNLTRLIPVGKAIIRPARGVEGPSCGLIPLLGPAVATTRGLKWNLDESLTMQIGGLVSTSNVLEGGDVWVETDNDLIWTTELRDATQKST